MVTKRIPDDPTPVIYWIQPDGSCLAEWPDGDVMVYSAEEWLKWRASLQRGEVVFAAGWGDRPNMKVGK